MINNPVSSDEFKAVISALHAQNINWIKCIESFTSLDSSNAYLMRAQGLIHGRVCVTSFQTHGKGRRGNAWISKPGKSLLFSVGWYPKQPVESAIGLVVGLAVIDALQSFGVTGLRLKWPNDVLHKRKKLAGILVESSFQAAKVKAVIGIGLNLHDNTKITEQINATTLDKAIKSLPDRGILLTKILMTLSHRLGQLETQGFKSMHSAWLQHLAFVNEPIQYVQNGVKQQGKLLNVDDNGSLLVKTELGVQTVISGEIHTLRSHA